MKKLISYSFILLLFVSSISNAYVGYKHTITNDSPDPIYIKLSYHGYVKHFSCRPDRKKKLMPGDKWTTKSYGCQLKKVYVKNLNTDEKTKINVHNYSKTGLLVSATVALTLPAAVGGAAVASGITAGAAATGATVTTATAASAGGTIAASSGAFGFGLGTLQLAYRKEMEEFYDDFRFIAYGSTRWTYKISDKKAPYLLPGKGVLGEKG